MSPAPTARAAPVPSCARWPRRRGSACTSIPRRIWCASTSAFASPAELVSDAALEAALEHVEQVNAGAAITVFEVITAVAFHLFAQTPADLCVLEVGLGGRGDATNVIADRPPARSPRSRSIIAKCSATRWPLIAAEKAGIMKPGVPVAIGTQPAEVLDVLLARPRNVSVHRCCCATATGASPRAAMTIRRRSGPAAAVAAGRVPARQRRHCHRRNARVRPARWTSRASLARSGRRGCSACTAGWRHCCRRTGSCGSTAGIIPGPASRWPSICEHGRIGRCM